MSQRSQAVLRRVYASIALCVPIYFFHFLSSTVVGSALSTLATVLTMALGVTTSALAYHDPSAICRTPIIIAYFTTMALWMVELGMIANTLMLLVYSGQIYKFIPLFVFGVIEGILVGGQGASLLWIGVQGMLEQEVGGGISLGNDA
ncbi:hypothetical protein BKA70DRAFT_1285498 [Coprinopsis sp. MPI-PUGE-AT-0042]|nr:hypothetical protein BKA70DRAFT_1285498 [Coprinopsis sp. MPI-PUGE-AT-0042]